MIDEAKRADEDLVAPLFEFRNYGLPLPHHWTTVNNGAAFGTDYFLAPPSGSRTSSSTNPRRRSTSTRTWTRPGSG